MAAEAAIATKRRTDDDDDGEEESEKKKGIGEKAGDKDELANPCRRF